MFSLFALLLAQAGPAAPVPASVPVLQAEEAGRFALAGVEKLAEARARIDGLTDQQLSAALTEALEDRSKLIYQAGHGVFVEYTAPDGQLRIWYPNNVGVVKGSWGTRKVGKRIRACFRYSNAVNPVTRVFEPDECPSAAQTLSEGNVLRSWQGDVFGLMSDRIPYRKGAMDMPSPEAPSGAGGAE